MNSITVTISEEHSSHFWKSIFGTSFFIIAHLSSKQVFMSRSENKKNTCSGDNLAGNKEKKGKHYMQYFFTLRFQGSMFGHMLGM